MEPESLLSKEIAREVDRRRTFAIISHPDAGKTTLTESCCCSVARFRWPAPSKPAKPPGTPRSD